MAPVMRCLTTLLKTALNVSLRQSPFLSVLSDQRVAETLQLMTHPATTPLTSGVTREVCLRTRSKAYIAGTISRLGSEYVVGLKALNCQNGAILAQEQVTATTKEKVLDQLGGAASRLRSELGESLASVQKFDVPLAEATTPSIEALKAYTAGWRVHSATGPSAAVPFYKRAIEIDPQFAMAYAWLGDMYGQMGESDLSAENLSKAYQLRDRASDAEKFFITASYYIRVTGNLKNAEQTCLVWAQTYPREMPAHGLLSGVIYMGLGRYEDGVEQGKKAVELNPDVAAVYAGLASDYLYLDRLNEAENTLRVAAERKVDSTDLSVLRYTIAFLKGDQAGMEQERVRAKAEDVMSYQEAFVQAYSGHLQPSRTLYQRASDFARQSGGREASGLFQAGAALPESSLGTGRWPGRRLWQPFSFPRTGKWSLAPASRSLSWETLPKLKHLSPIWNGASRKILPSDSPTRRRFGRSWRSIGARRRRPLSSYKSPLRMNLLPRAAHFTVTSALSIRFMFAARPMWRRSKARRPQRNSRKFYPPRDRGQRSHWRCGPPATRQSVRFIGG